jgi:hypothetical protein
MGIGVIQVTLMMTLLVSVTVDVAKPTLHLLKLWIAKQLPDLGARRSVLAVTEEIVRKFWIIFSQRAYGFRRVANGFVHTAFRRQLFVGVTCGRTIYGNGVLR